MNKAHLGAVLSEVIKLGLPGVFVLRLLCLLLNDVQLRLLQKMILIDGWMENNRKLRVVSHCKRLKTPFVWINLKHIYMEVLLVLYVLQHEVKHWFLQLFLVVPPDKREVWSSPKAGGWTGTGHMSPSAWLAPTMWQQVTNNLAHDWNLTK